MRAFYYLGEGTTGSDVLHCLMQNSYLVPDDEELTCSLVIESDLSGQNHHYPKTDVVLESPNVPRFFIPIPEKDLLKAFQRGEMGHLNFNQHGHLRRNDTEAGMALLRGLGYVASIIHGDELREKQKADIKVLGDVCRGKELQLECWCPGTAIGGTGSSVYFPIRQSFSDIEQQTGGGFRLTINDYYVIPNFGRGSDLSPRHFANTAAWAREVAAIQVGYLRHSRVSREGRQRPTGEPLATRLFLSSDLNIGGIFQPGHLIATMARVIEWMTMTPIGEVFRAELVNVEAAVFKPGIPLVNRIGGASIYFPVQEEEAYREARLNARVIESALRIPSRSRQRAQQVLSEKRLQEDFNRGDLSLLIDEVKGTRLSRSYLESLGDFEPKSKRALKQMEEIEKFFNHHEEEVLPRLLSEMKKSRLSLQAKMEALPATIVKELLASNNFGPSREIFQQIFHALKLNLDQVEARAGQEAQREGELRTSAETLRERIVKYPTLAWWRKLLYMFRLKGAVRKYQSYRHQISKIAVAKHLKTEAANLMKVLIKAFGLSMSKLEEIDIVLNALRQKAVKRYQALDTDSFPNRGVGQALLPGSFAQRFNGSELAEEAFHTISGHLSKKVKDLISGLELSNPEATLERFLSEQVRQAFQSFISQPWGEDVTKLLLEDPDRDNKLRSLIIQASETTPEDKLKGRGKRINVLGIKGGENSLLFLEIQRLAKELKVTGEIKVAEIDDPSQIILVRSEIGRELSTIKVLEACEREYQLLGKERFRCHREPLLGLLTGSVNPPTKEESYKFFIYGLASGAIVQEQGKRNFSHKTLNWGQATVGMPEEEEKVLAWAKDYKVALDAAGRYIFLIQQESFQAAKRALEGLKNTYRKESWSSYIDEVMEELKYLAKLYHQEV